MSWKLVYHASTSAYILNWCLKEGDDEEGGDEEGYEQWKKIEGAD